MERFFYNILRLLRVFLLILHSILKLTKKLKKMSENVKALKPSEEKIWQRFYELNDVVNPNCDVTAYNYIKNSMTDRMDRRAFYYFGACISYEKLFAEIDRYANAFDGMGVKKGDNVTVVMANTPESAYIFYALNKIGAVTVFVDPRMTDDRISHFVELAKSKVLVTLDLVFPKTLEAIEKFNIEHVVVTSASCSLPWLKKILFNLKAPIPKIQFDEKIMRLDAWLKKYEPMGNAKEAAYEDESICAVVQTGGTTGTPKGVMITNKGINCVARDLAYVNVFRNETHRFLNIIPVFSSYGLAVGLHTPMVVKAETVLIPNFKPEDFPNLIAKYKPNGVIAVPAFYDLWLSSPKLAKADLSHLCVCIAGGDKMTPEMEIQLTKFLNERGGRYHVAQGYGMSEVSSVVSFSFENVNCKGSAGVPLYHASIGAFKPGTDEELGYNEQGEICMSGDTLMKGYLGMPEETAEVMKLHSDGKVWVHSGDVGYIDENGFIHVKSRIKHMITRFDGHKVFPVQIENVVYNVPEVETCAVIACQDRTHAVGHHPLIAVKRYPGDMSDAELRKKILDHCFKNIEERAHPCGVIFLDEMPLTGFGKIDVKVLEAEYENYDYTKD